MRFMMQYDPGHGDYTKERQEIFADLDLEDLLASIRRQGIKLVRRRSVAAAAACPS